MSGNDYYEPGQWNARCSMCSFKRKSGTLVKNWQGMWRCPEHNEPRQPQDFVRAVPDVQTPPWVQPQEDVVYQSTDFFITEDSDTTFGPLIYFITESGNEPFETEN